VNKKSEPKDDCWIPIGIMPEWLLKTETGRGLWEHLIPDKDFREAVMAKTRERLRWTKGELFYEEGL
jgi:hypothetical protein